MSPNKTSNKTPHIFVYVQLLDPKNNDPHLEDSSSSFIRQLGNILMPFTETWEISYIEQRERGFFVQFKHEIDALDFSLAFLERVRETNDFEVGVAIHCGNDVLSAQRENEKLILFAGPNEVVVSGTLNFHKIQDSHHKWERVGEIKSEETGGDLGVFVHDTFSETPHQKEDIFQNLKIENLRMEYLIPLIILVFVGLFFLLPKEKLEPTIAVWMMENRGEMEDDFLAWGITEDITEMLDHSQNIRTVPFDEITEAFSSDSSPIETAAQYGMNYVLVSEFNKVENGVDIYYSLVNVKTGKSVYSKKQTVPPKHIPNIVGFLSRRIMISLDVNDIEFIESRMPINPDAYKLYLKGKYVLGKALYVDQIDQGISLLEESIRLDDNLLHAKSLLAEVNRERGDLSKARELYTEAMTKAGDEGNKQMVRKYSVSLGDIFLEMDDLSNALKCYQNALSFTEKLRYSKYSPHILNQMALIYFKREAPDSAEYYLKESINISHQLKDSLSTVSELLFLGNIYYNSEDYYNALIRFEKSLEYSKHIEDTTATSSALHYISDIYWIKKDFTRALLFQSELLSFLKKRGDTNSIAWATFRMGSIYENQCDYVQAERYLSQSLKLRRSLGEKRNIAEVLSYLGIVSLNMEQYNKAQHYFNESKRIYEDYRDRSGLSYMSHNLGETYYYKGNSSKSEGYFRKAVTIWRELQDPSKEVWSLSWLILAEMESGNREYEVDLYILNKILKQNKIEKQDIPIVSYNLYLVYKKKKMTEESAYHLKKAYNEIVETANEMNNEDDRNSFLTINPLNRKIVKDWEKLIM
ncbi:MAG: tetratricopeptide repeat protein [Candidatus Marinimicrobia bacterium]|nr:tetratricopeptide repeat protein [Candidatus Neomarinimicrobiota bacterium]